VKTFAVYFDVPLVADFPVLFNKFMVYSLLIMADKGKRSAVTGVFQFL
jgi:hypothetical protein